MEHQRPRYPARPGSAPEWNPIGAAIGAGAAGLVGAGVWAGITIATGYEIGWIALGVGYICGLGAARGGEVPGPANGVLAAVVAAASVFLGKFFATRAAISDYLIEEGIEGGPTTALVLEILPNTLGGMDVVFFGLALYTAFQVAGGMASRGEPSDEARGPGAEVP